MNDKRLSVGQVLRAGTVGALILTAGSAVALRAQGLAGNPIDAFLARMDDVSAKVDTVLAKLDDIIGLVTPAPPPLPGRVVMSTPIVYVGVGQMVACWAANVGSDQINEIFIRRVSYTGAVLQSATFGGVQEGTSVQINEFDSQAARCEVRFNGSADAVRANMLLTAGAPTTTVASVEAR